MPHSSSGRATQAALTILAVLAVFLPVTLFVPSATAATRTVRDGRDTPATTDITRTRFSNARGRISATIWVRNLGHDGDFNLMVGATSYPNEDAPVLMARIRETARGTLALRLIYSRNETLYIHCDHMRGRWSTQDSVVGVSFPTSCMRNGAAAGSFSSRNPPLWAESRYIDMWDDTKVVRVHRN